MAKKALGRGLSSLIPTVSPVEDKEEVSVPQIKTKESPKDETSVKTDRIIHLEIAEIEDNPYQPRKDMNSADLNSLAESIKVHGILQPLVVSINPHGGYIVVAGHRRLAAAKRVGMKEVPAIIRETGDLEKLELAMIENIQRSDLNAIELAEGYHQLMQDFSLTQDQVATKMGKSRSVVANTLRLLKLPDVIQHSLAVGEINEYQARNLLSLKTEKEQIDMWEQMKKGEMTGTKALTEVQRTKVRTHDRALRKDPSTIAQEEALEEVLGTKVKIKNNNGKGQVVIEFYTPEDLGSIVGKLTE